jgi:hypothetical protein
MMTDPVRALVDRITGNGEPTQREVMLQPRAAGDPKTEHCVVCDKAILTMIYKGTGVCGDQHRKIRDDIPMGDLITTKGWYHTCAKNLRNHHGHEVRFTLRDPWVIYEGKIGHVNFGEEGDTIGIVLESGFTTLSTAEYHMGRPPVEHFDAQYATEFPPYRVVEVRRCR